MLFRNDANIERAMDIGASVWFAEYGSKGNNEKLFSEVVTDVHDPAAPILCIACRTERPHDAFRMVACFGQAFDRCAASINQNTV